MSDQSTPKTALESLRDPRWKASRLGLERTLALLERMGNPQCSLRFVHVTGTNGKGSTAAMLSSMLTEAGYRTGLFTSPYLERVNEEIQINRQPISDDALEATAAITQRFADQLEDHPTEFEMLVCTALLHFQAQDCALVVIEVGMGGLRDATNVIPAPEVAVITPIALDHTGILGDTVEKIAAEKSGIIKPGCSVAIAPQLPTVQAVLEQACGQNGVSSCVVDLDLLQNAEMSVDGLHFDWCGEALFLPLLGRHQLQNVATALTAVALLVQRGWRISPDAIKEGLSRTVWPGRLEPLGTDPFFLLDGAHNPQGADALAAALTELFPDEKFLFLLGVLADKDRERMLASFRPLADRFVTITPENPRALPADQLARELLALGFAAESADTISQGVDRVLALAKPNERICAFGSLYQAGAVRQVVLSRLCQSKRKQ